jgi:putative ABC transport system permease protein
MALGAQYGDVMKLVVRHGMFLAGLGLAIGLAGAFALTRLLSAMLYGVSATDPLTFTAVSLALAGVAFCACYLPARRATRIDPIVALRYE